MAAYTDQNIETSASSESTHIPLHHQLGGNMSTLQLVFAVFSYNAPLGVLAIVVALTIGYGIGVGAPLLFIALGLLMGLFAVGYTTMSRHLPNPGAFYSYITAGLGRPLGLGSSFVAMISYTCAMAGVLIFTSMAMQSLLHTMLQGPDIVWWIWALLFVAIISILGYLNVDVSARMLGILLGLELLIVVVWDAVVLISRGSNAELTFSSFDPHVALAGSVAVGLIYAVTCFSGFEATAIFRDEVRDPHKTIPRATYLTIALLTVFYSLGSWALIQAIGEKNAVAVIAANPSTAFFDMISQYLGNVGYHLVNVLIISGGFAAMMAYHNVLSRYLFSLGVDGILPKAIGISHPQLRSPYRASVLLSSISFIFVLTLAVLGTSPDIYIQFTGIAGYSFVVLFALAAIGISSYLLRTSTIELSFWQRFIAPTSAAILLSIITIITTRNIDLLTGSANLSTTTLVLTFGSLIAGIFIALLFRIFKPEIFVRIGRQ